MKKFLTAAFIVMLMACICIGGALFVQAQEGSNDSTQHAHDNWTYDYEQNIATCAEDDCDVTCNHEGTLTVTRTVMGEHKIVCSVCHYEETEDCYGGVSASCTLLPVCVVCSNPYDGEYGAHTMAPVASRHEENPSQYHVLTYPCCDRTVDEAHTQGKAATCLRATICAVCDLQYGSKDPAIHDASNVTYEPLDATHHKVICQCGDEIRTTTHSGGTATCTKQAVCADCGTSYGALSNTHRYSNHCDADCNVCGATRTPAAHVFGDWKTTKQPTETKAGEKERACTVCGKTETEELAALADPNASDKSDDEKSAPIVVIIVVVAVVVVAGAAVAVVLLMKKKKTGTNEKAEETEEIDTNAETDVTEEDTTEENTTEEDTTEEDAKEETKEQE